MAPAGLELTTDPGLVLNSRSSCLYLPHAGMTGVGHISPILAVALIAVMSPASAQGKSWTNIEQLHLFQKKASINLVTVRPKQLNLLIVLGGKIFALNLGQASLCLVTYAGASGLITVLLIPSHPGGPEAPADFSKCGGSAESYSPPDSGDQPPGQSIPSCACL